MPKVVQAATTSRATAVYLPIVPIYGGRVTLFSRKGGVYTNSAEADAIIRELPAGKQALAEIVPHDDPRRLTSTLALGDVRELIGRAPKVQNLSHTDLMGAIFCNDGKQ